MIWKPAGQKWLKWSRSNAKRIVHLFITCIPYQVLASNCIVVVVVVVDFNIVSFP